MPIGKGRKVLLYYNPYSGTGRIKDCLDYIIKEFQKKCLIIVPIRASFDFSLDDFFEKMDQHQYRQIIVCGGDGTINICVNSMIRHDIYLPLAIFPAGTANDFAYNFGIPDDLEKQVAIALGNYLKKTDIGKVNEKYFINVAAMGTMVDVSQKTDPNMKNTLGTFAYYLKGASEIPNLKPILMKFITEEKTFDEKIYFMVVMNGCSAGGFRQLSPDSNVNDGLLDVVVFKKMSLAKFPPLFLKLLQGKHDESNHVLKFKTSKLRLEADADVPTDIDGEYGAPFPLDFSVLPGRIEIFAASDDMYIENMATAIHNGNVGK